MTAASPGKTKKPSAWQRLASALEIIEKTPAERCECRVRALEVRLDALEERLRKQ
jgi:polyhydroxyalkanoate synthesis regulator phasin